MSDVLSRILGGLMGGGGVGGGGMGGGVGGAPLGVPRLPGSEAGRSGGMLGGGMAPGGMGGGLGSILGGLLGGGQRVPSGGGGLGGIASGLGGMKGLALMALLAYMMRGRGGASGLSSLTEHLRGSGLGPQVDSWIGPGANQEVRPEEVARAIPPEMLDEVTRETGMGRDEVLSQLSRGLPGMVDRLTPRGRLPERDDELNDHDEGDLLSGFGIGPVRRT